MQPHPTAYDFAHSIESVDPLELIEAVRDELEISFAEASSAVYDSIDRISLPPMEAPIGWSPMRKGTF